MVIGWRLVLTAASFKSVAGAFAHYYWTHWSSYGPSGKLVPSYITIVLMSAAAVLSERTLTRASYRRSCLLRLQPPLPPPYLFQQFSPRHRSNTFFSASFFMCFALCIFNHADDFRCVCVCVCVCVPFVYRIVPLVRTTLIHLPSTHLHTRWLRSSAARA